MYKPALSGVFFFKVAFIKQNRENKKTYRYDLAVLVEPVCIKKFAHVLAE